MKPAGTHMMNTPAPKGGMVRQISSSTPMLPSASKKLRMVCPICENVFLRWACKVKPYRVSYCGWGCKVVGQMVRHEHPCLTCGKSMLLPPLLSTRKLTCSAVCSSVRKRSRGNGAHPQSWAAYKEAAAAIRATGTCVKCGVRHGPWVVRGLSVTAVDGELPAAEGLAASLWCQSCHLNDVAADGGKARQELRRSRGSEPVPADGTADNTPASA